MSKPVHALPDTSKAYASIEAAREALAAGRHVDAMLAIGRAELEYRSAMRAAETNFREVLARLAEHVMRTAMPMAGRGALH